MPDSNSPTATKTTDELIIIVNNSTGKWQEHEVDEAWNELNRRGLTNEIEQKLFNNWDEGELQRQISHQEKSASNANESYSLPYMIYIFFASPLILIRVLSLVQTLFELKKEKYRKKFTQRLLLLIAGITFWILFIYISGVNQEKRTREEINKEEPSQLKEQDSFNDSSTSKGIQPK